MKKICIVGSLSGIFTHSYIRGYLLLGYSVSIINTSNKIHYENYHGCPVINTTKIGKNKVGDSFKANIKSSSIFCYFYEAYLGFRIGKYKNNALEKFVTEQSIDTYIFFWGTSLRKEFHFIKKVESSKKRVPLYVVDVATYPIRDYALSNTPSFLLYFDTKYFNGFDFVLSHSSVLDHYLIDKLHVESKKIKRFICSFPSISYHKFEIDKGTSTLKKIIFLGTLDRSSKINNISSDIYALANNGIKVYVQNDGGFEHENIIEFKAFTYEEIINGLLGDFCAQFDGVLVAYGEMSTLREKLTYPTRFALALLSSVPIFIHKHRFESLLEIIASGSYSNDIVLYEKITDLIDYKKNRIEETKNHEDYMEAKLLNLNI